MSETPDEGLRVQTVSEALDARDAASRAAMNVDTRTEILVCAPCATVVVDEMGHRNFHGNLAAAGVMLTTAWSLQEAVRCPLDGPGCTRHTVRVLWL